MFLNLFQILRECGKNKEKDDLVSERDRHGYVTRDMSSSIQNELDEETLGSLLSALIHSSVIKNSAPQNLESCHPGWEIIEVSVENMERII